jgi:hypothetical protein
MGPFNVIPSIRSHNKPATIAQITPVQTNWLFTHSKHNGVHALALTTSGHTKARMELQRPFMHGYIRPPTNPDQTQRSAAAKTTKNKKDAATKNKKQHNNKPPNPTAQPTTQTPTRTTEREENQQERREKKNPNKM